MLFSRISRLAIFAALLAATAGTDAFAITTGGSEVAFFMPWKFVEQKLQDAFASRPIVKDQKFDNADWPTNPWLLHLHGVEWKLDTKLDLISLNSQNVQLKSKKLSFAITIKQLLIDQWVEQEIGGAIIRVHMQGQCGPITMSQTQAQTDGQLGYQVQPQHIATHVDKFDLSWPANSWQINSIACTGPLGFDVKVKDELTKALTSAEVLKPFLQPLLAKEAQTEADAMLNEMANPLPIPMDKTPLTPVLTFQRMENLPEGIVNYGNIVWSGKAGETNLSRLILNGLPAVVAKNAGAVFISPTDGWSNLIHTQLAVQPITKRINLNKVKPFADLLASEMMQRVAWPDLLNYTSLSPFTMVLTTPKNYSLQWQSDGTAILQSPVNFEMLSVRQEYSWDYLNVTGNVHGKLHILINNGKLNVAINVDDSTFTPHFESAYVKQYSPNTYIDPRVMKGVEDYVDEGFKYSTTLPTLKLGPVGTATFNGWMGISKDLVAIPMKLNVKEPAGS